MKNTINTFGVVGGTGPAGAKGAKGDKGDQATGNITGPASAVSGAVVVWNGTTGTAVSDSTILMNNVVLNQTGLASANGNISTFTDTSGIHVKDSGVAVGNVVQGPVSAISQCIPIWNGVSGKLLSDSTILMSVVVLNQTGNPSVNGNVVMFNGVGGTEIMDSGVAAAHVVVGLTPSVQWGIPKWYDVNANKMITSGYIIDSNDVIYKGATIGAATQVISFSANRTAIGMGSGTNPSDLSTNWNTYIGSQSGQANTTGNNNTFLGASAGIANTSGASNTFVGYLAGSNNTSGGTNTAVGMKANAGCTTTSNNTAVGYNAGLANVGQDCVYVGYNSGLAANVFAASSNTCVGSQTAVALTVGNATMVGFKAGNAATSGTGLTFLGYQAGMSTTTAIHHTALGYRAGESNITGGGNTYVGSLAGQVATSSNNTCLGTYTGNVMTGSNNTFLGYQSGKVDTTGASNTCVGYNSGVALTTGGSNYLFGTSAGSVYTTESNNICIGHLGVAADNGIMRIGTTATHTRNYQAGIYGVTTVGTAVAVVVDANGGLGTVSSSARFKKNIRDIEDVSFLHKLRVVNFEYKEQEGSKVHAGLVAEEVEALRPDLIIYKDGEVLTVDYQYLYICALRAIQQQQSVIESCVSRLERLEAKLFDIGVW